MIDNVIVCIYDNYVDMLIYLKSGADSNICKNNYVYYDFYDSFIIKKKTLKLNAIQALSQLSYNPNYIQNKNVYNGRNL